MADARGRGCGCLRQALCCLRVQAQRLSQRAAHLHTPTSDPLLLPRCRPVQAEVTRSHRMEGSYINKSLLTLGTVIHKLSDGHAAHIPFRDSKLTRLLQNSLTGACWVLLHTPLTRLLAWPCAEHCLLDPDWQALGAYVLLGKWAPLSSTLPTTGFIWPHCCRVWRQDGCGVHHHPRLHPGRGDPQHP